MTRCTLSNFLTLPLALLLLNFAVAGLVLNSVREVNAEETLVYSFEPDLEGFTNNGSLEVSQETSGLGATQGSNSMKVVHPQFNGFAGTITSNLSAGFPTLPEDPGIDFLRFDLTLTSRFSPDGAVAGVDPTFADLGITFFGALPGNPVAEAQIQYLYDQKEVGSFEAGTYTLEIDLRSNGGDFGIGAGLNVDTGVIKGYNDWIDAGFVPAEFQIYSNKSVNPTDSRYEWTFYVDNVRVGRDVLGVPGDYNGNGTVDAADYVVWRNGDSPDDSQAGYDLWKANFGKPGAAGSGNGATLGAVPEPTSALLMVAAGLYWWGVTLRRKAR